MVRIRKPNQKLQRTHKIHGMGNMETEDKIMAIIGTAIAIFFLIYSIAVGIACYQSLTSNHDIREKTINLNLGENK